MSTALDPAPTPLDPAGVAARRAGWDALMAGFVPGLPALEQAVLDTAERLSGPPRRVLDLGGGPGLFAERMAGRWPGAHIVLADIDPVLLALAHDGLPAAATADLGMVTPQRAAMPPEPGVLTPAGARVTALHADLADPGWPARTGAGFDLVVAVMTVHYLAPESVWSLYAGVRRVLAPGGLLVVADVLPDDGLPTVMRALDPAPGEAGHAWSRWWAELAGDPGFHELLAARAAIFRDRPAAGFTAGPAWHADAARAAGFLETGLIWRSGRHAAFAAH